MCNPKKLFVTVKQWNNDNDDDDDDDNDTKDTLLEFHKVNMQEKEIHRCEVERGILKAP